MGDQIEETVPFRFDVEKKVLPRGPLHRYRLKRATAFTCCRCSKDKTSKNIVSVHDKWELLLCNGCYGWLLSVWEIKEGDLPETERHAGLLKLLSELVGESQVQRARSVLLARDTRASQLSSAALTMLATAEAVAEGFAARTVTELDWSAAVIPLCKAVEVEAGRLVYEPLRAAVVDQVLAGDRARFKTMVRFCQDNGPLSLGAMSYFMSSVAAAPRSVNSPLVVAIRLLASRWPRSDWLFSANGFTARVRILTNQYRNPAAHTDLLSKSEYRACVEDVRGSDGILWHLLAAVVPTHR